MTTIAYYVLYMGLTLVTTKRLE